MATKTKNAVAEFTFEDISLEDAKALTAVTRTKESQWRKVVDAFLASGKPSAIVRVDNGKSPQSQSQSVSAVLRKAAENDEIIPMKVRPREQGLIFIRTDVE